MSLTLSAPYKTPVFMERGLPTILQCPVYGPDLKTLLEPDSGTISIYRPDQTLLVEDAVVDLIDGVASYEVTASDVEDLGSRWIVLWGLVYSGVTRRFRRDGALVRQLVYPVIDELSIYKGRHRDLDDILESAEHSDLSDYIEAAWDDLIEDLLADGRFVHQLLSPYVLRGVHRARTLYRIFFDAGTSSEKYMETAKEYEAVYRRQWSAIVAKFDTDDDGFLDSSEDAGTKLRHIAKGGGSRRGW